MCVGGGGGRGALTAGERLNSMNPPLFLIAQCLEADSVANTTFYTFLSSFFNLGERNYSKETLQYD